MCEFVTKTFIDGQRIQTKYQVLSFEFETAHCWFFNVRAVEVKVHGKIHDVTQPVKLIGFQKRREEKGEGEVECMPPNFYNKMRDKALIEDMKKQPGYGTPPLEDEELFA